MWTDRRWRALSLLLLLSLLDFVPWQAFGEINHSIYIHLPGLQIEISTQDETISDEEMKITFIIEHVKECPFPEEIFIKYLIITIDYPFSPIFYQNTLLYNQSIKGKLSITYTIKTKEYSEAIPIEIEISYIYLGFSPIEGIIEKSYEGIFRFDLTYITDKTREDFLNELAALRRNYTTLNRNYASLKSDYESLTKYLRVQAIALTCLSFIVLALLALAVYFWWKHKTFDKTEGASKEKLKEDILKYKSIKSLEEESLQKVGIYCQNLSSESSQLQNYRSLFLSVEAVLLSLAAALFSINKIEPAWILTALGLTYCVASIVVLKWSRSRVDYWRDRIFEEIKDTEFEEIFKVFRPNYTHKIPSPATPRFWFDVLLPIVTLVLWILILLIIAH